MNCRSQPRVRSMSVDLLDCEQTAAVWRSRFPQSAQRRLSDNDGSRTDTDRLSLYRSEPAKKSGQNISKNRYRTTIAERMVKSWLKQTTCSRIKGSSVLTAPRPAGAPKIL